MPPRDWRREKEEGKRYESLLEDANAQREFLIALGEGLYDMDFSVAEGPWRMPFGEMWMEHRGNELIGAAEIEEPIGLGSLLAGPPVGESRRVQRYILSGPVTGRVCKFRLRVSAKGGSALLGTLPGKSSEGYLVFHARGSSAQYAELEGDKLSKFWTVERVVVPPDSVPGVGRSE